MNKKPAFKATRLTSTVFQLTEYSDIYSEYPFIYLKLLPEVIVLIDSGCGGKSTDPEVNLTSLREFIETVPIEDNDGKPFNGDGPEKREYIVICTHCHYDHILGLEQFTEDSPIYASSHSPSFLSPKNLPHNSLCQRLGIQTPTYTPTLIDHLSPILFHPPNQHQADQNQPKASSKSPSINTSIQILHTPGHTPDSLAIWDKSEQMLYVGDTLYAHSPIIFPPEGNLTHWFRSIDLLISVCIDHTTTATSPTQTSIQTPAPTQTQTPRLNAGHSSSLRPALSILSRAKSFLKDVVSGLEPIQDKITVPLYPAIKLIHQSLTKRTAHAVLSINFVSFIYSNKQNQCKTVVQKKYKTQQSEK
ncbi:Metallo-hydrolase oxidoreductase [Pyrrhoderma noxium]|uniref:Metallo-hydrolase oxidoreductase n=1 Tax=Pyrrhoderma noxium TaxID=2282107 RepID=A0A286UAZ4_9AGAM|nr:Metallo-hydrolase oxidoreductase [Pyrrhoderma noxium]